LNDSPGASGIHGNDSASVSNDPKANSTVADRTGPSGHAAMSATKSKIEIDLD
jgi:hypothetical protein